MPERAAVTGQTYGRIDRDGFSVEKVVLQSYPGHYVTGSLFRPLNAKGTCPAVLSPHGHWPDGRFNLAEDVRDQVATGAERSAKSGRAPLQARCVQLARMGCVVLLYDMLGYADSVQIPQEVIHAPSQQTILQGREHYGFYSVQAELRMQSPLGVQTYNSLCALDWLSSLPEVDPQRIGVTGGSSGATQILMLCAVDDRPRVAFPVVMVSTAMQGGCPCENACCLRMGGVSNVEFAALMAPKPLGMASANDWTVDFARDGFPELQTLYRLLGAPDQVMHADLTQYPHNYNWASRQAMYPWMAKWLGLPADTPVVEREFEPLGREELTVWDAQHPAPTPGREHEAQLMQAMADQSAKVMHSLRPKDTQSLDQFVDVQQAAYRVLLDQAPLEAAGDIRVTTTRGEGSPARGVRFHDRRTGVTTGGMLLGEWGGPVVLWITPNGSQALFDERGVAVAKVNQLRDAGVAVLGLDLPLQPTPTGYRLPTVEGMRPAASLTYGYNPTLVACRASDILTVLEGVRQKSPGAKIGIAAHAGTAPYAAAAAALAPEILHAVLLDTGGFRFADLESWRDPDFLPGAVKYGDLGGMLACFAPRPLLIAGDSPATLEWTAAAYRAAGALPSLRPLTAADGLNKGLDRLAELLRD